MSERQNSDGLLSGCRVLDLADEKGLLCGRILGDFGADVIKIERPGGDPARNIGPFYHDIPDPQKSLFWFYTNLNKRGITLNLETADGRDIFKRLVKTAHFLVESFEPGYMASLGLGYPDLEKINPAIIMTSVTPFGQTGPHAHYKGSDIVGVGMGGIMRMYGDRDRPPVRTSQPQFYFLGCLHGALGSIVAHYHRELTGEGQYIDTSCQDATTMALMIAAEYWDILKVNYVRSGAYGVFPKKPPEPPLYRRHIYPVKDGHILTLLMGGALAGMVTSSKRIVEIANRDGMCLDLKDYDWTKLDYATVYQKEMDSITEPLAQFFLTKTKRELFDEAVKRSMMLCPVTTAKDVAENPQLAIREFWVAVEHPELGETITYPGAPVRVPEFPWRITRRAPLIGEHNLEIYEEEMGFTREQLSLLKARGVI